MVKFQALRDSTEEISFRQKACTALRKYHHIRAA